MMGCDNSDYSYCVTNFPGPGVTEVLEEPVEEESEGEVSDVMDGVKGCGNWSEREVIN